MTQIKLKKISTLPPKDVNKEKIKEKTAEYIKEIGMLQHKLNAEKKTGLLVVLQGLDASGKDGATRVVFNGSNPQGVSVSSFKVPTEEEASHDFLWRIHKETPAKGMIKIFNRSHYEDVLVTRVLGLIDDKEARKRMNHINDFEKLLEESGTVILKFYLHISPEEQASRFHERIENPEKQWKYNPRDLETAKKWPQFRTCYEDVIEHCSDVPWIIVPSDKNWYKAYLIAKHVVEALKKMKIEFPKLKA